MNWKRIPESQGWIQRIGEEAVRLHTFMPRMIDLEVSRVCNLACPACMRRADSSLAQTNGNAHYCTLDRFKEMHEQMPTLGTLNFMGDGEPLMNPELSDIIRYASLNGIYTVVTSNTTLVTEQIVRQWERNKVYRVHASVDAPSKELYESMRVGAVWEKTLENLRILGNSSIPLCLNVVLTNENIHAMPDMVLLAKDVGASEITYLMPICTYGDDNDTRPEDSPENRAKFLLALKGCIELDIEWVFPLTLNPTFRRFSFPFIRPEISIEGDLWACCYSLGRGKNWVFGHCIDIPEGTYNMGNMFQQGFREVWHGEAYKELRAIYKRTEEKKGAVISRSEYLRRIEEVESRKNKGRFDHCEICPARWGTACS